MSKKGVKHTKGFRNPRKRVEVDQRIVDGESVTYKKCTKCDEWKPLSGFSRNGRKGTLGRCSQCKVCRANYKKGWDIENKGYNSKYHHKHKKRRNEQSKQWKRDNYKQHRDYQRKWSLENKDKKQIYELRRSAAKKFLPNNWIDEELLSTLNFFRGCALTGESDIHWDHFIPLATFHGGTTVGNMVPMLNRLNESKNNWNYFEWIESDRQRFELLRDSHEQLIEFIASANALTIDEYEEFYYWCFDNKREIDEVINDKRHSIEIWREKSGRQIPLPKFAYEDWSEKLAI